MRFILVRAPTADDYVYVDWGPAFSAQRGAHSPAFGEAATHLGFGPLGLAYLLKVGGRGYLRRGLVTPLLRNGRLSLVDGAPEFAYPAYAVYAEGADQRVDVDLALSILRKLLASNSTLGGGVLPSNAEPTQQR